jgi:hypothetical protein
MKIYFDLFETQEDIIKEFAINSKELEGAEILYASYDTPPYEGYAQVIFRKDDKLYEVNGSHCSCNGLEGCWVPEETSILALLSRPNVHDQAKANIKEVYKKLLVFL